VRFFLTQDSYCDAAKGATNILLNNRKRLALRGKA
jgi:hypothetical protein